MKKFFFIFLLSFLFIALMLFITFAPDVYATEDISLVIPSENVNLNISAIARANPTAFDNFTIDENTKFFVIIGQNSDTRLLFISNDLFYMPYGTIFVKNIYIQINFSDINSITCTKRNDSGGNAIVGESSFSNFHFYLNYDFISSRSDRYEPKDLSNYNCFFINSNIITGFTPPVVYSTPTLMIDDYNFRKSFKFEFEIPQVRPDSKYFVFLKDYTRNSYSSVTANFQVISVTTPEGYDYSNYNNYLYYDNRDKKLYLPAGCYIEIYEGSGNNNSIVELDLIDSATLPHFNLGALTSLTYSGTIFLNEYDYYDLIPTSYSISSNFIGNVITTILNNLSLQAGGSPISLRFPIVDSFLQYLDVPMTIEEFRFQTYLNALYYGNSVAESLSYDSNFADFCFGNANIVSYENTKYDNSVNNTYYHFFRYTNIYNLDNQVNINLYRFQYTDAEDVSSMLPSGISTDYLSSPFYQDNFNASTGGNITYNINQVFYQYNDINYGVENSPLRREPTQDTLSDSTTDNAILDNNTTEEISSTSQENWFRNIYKTLLDIQEILNKIAKGIENFNSNITYNISSNFNYLFMPNPLDYQDLLDNFSDLAEEHLGIVFQPFEFSYFILHEISQITDFNTITLNIPAVYFNDVAIIPAYNFDFATILENQTFSTIHEFTLAGTDFLFIFMISSYAIEVFKEVFGSNDN